MTNPGSIVRVRARNGGRASVYEANGWAQGFTAGLLDGNGVIQNTSANMNVLVGGSTTKPDVVLATNPSGYRIALDLVGQQAVAITAPASNSRITSIVAYTNDLAVASTQTTTTGSPATCGLIAVNGTSSASPVEPSDATIRSAITADGGTGSQACYCVIANIVVSSNTTAITDSLITLKRAQVNIPDGNITSNKIANGAVTADKLGLSQITVGINQLASVAANGTIPLAKIVGQNGLGITLNENSLVIGAGVNKILVSASATCNGASGSYLWYVIRKNNNSTIAESLVDGATTGYTGGAIAPIVLSVAPGDIFTLRNVEGSRDYRVEGTFMTIQQIA